MQAQDVAAYTSVAQCCQLIMVDPVNLVSGPLGPTGQWPSVAPWLRHVGPALERAPVALLAAERLGPSPGFIYMGSPGT